MENAVMNYQQTVDYLNDQKHPNIKPGLGTITRLMGLLGNPQDHLRYVHIAGTNGKGSTAACIESILRTAGYKTGLFTSPYIEHFTERIRSQGQEIFREDLIRLTARVKEVADQLAAEEIYPTPFELQTAVAFLYFLEQACEIVVLEVGLGGRLDSTNVIKEAEVSVITPIGMDHMNFLGSRLADIANEKAGIIKENGRVVSSLQKEEARKVIEDRCRNRHARLAYARTEKAKLVRADLQGQVFTDPVYGTLTIHLMGPHQIANACLALSAVDVLKERGFDISISDIRQGLDRTRWKGRMEVLGQDPVILIDGAHNVDGVEALQKGLLQLFPDRKLILITGVLADKDYPEMMRMMEPLAKEFWTLTPNSPRALPADDLARILKEDGCQASACRDIGEAVDRCRKAEASEVICAFGSLYMIGALRTALLEEA